MLNSTAIIIAGLIYVGALFAVATWGDRIAGKRPPGSPRPFIYAMSLGVYCTSWTYFGSVGLAAKSGFDFFPIYLGPILVFTLGWKMLQYIAALAKRQNITSIADFIAARYGKNGSLGALVALIAVIGIVPYISLQLKAVALSLQTVMGEHGRLAAETFGGDTIALVVTAALAIFAILFGTRHIDTTEHQDGLVLAISIESIIKLLAFLTVGIFVVYQFAGGPSQLLASAAERPEVMELFTRDFDGGRWITMTLLSMFAIILLPRQFHMAVVENAHRSDIRRAAWLFPAYLIAINIFVVPIAILGLLHLPAGSDADTFVLALPVLAGNEFMTLVAFIGGISAATAMVIVEAVALSIMVCNSLVVPLVLRQRLGSVAPEDDMGHLLVTIRRVAIVTILVLAYGYYAMIGSSVALAQIGLISFAAVAQFAPAFFGGLLWRRGTARGARAGLIAGFVLWTYTLLLPSLADAGWLASSFVTDGPWGVSLLRPRVLFYLEFDPLTHGVFWSLVANVSAFVFFSLTRQPSPVERTQARSFVGSEAPVSAAGFRLWRTTLTAGELQETVARYLGVERTEKAFARFAHEHDARHDPKAQADLRLLRFAEHLLASAVGTASSRLVMKLLLEGHTKHARGGMQLLDDANAAIQYNRDLLQSAIDNVKQGIAVFDVDFNLICWNAQFEALLDLNSDISRIGAPLQDVVEAMLSQASATAVNASTVADRVRKIAVTREAFRERLDSRGTVLEVRSGEMPDGGTVVTFADITESYLAAEALKRANETLERRVAERTAELMSLNAELEHARARSENANQEKTRFIAAASHDILQPLNAARLFTASLMDRHAKSKDRDLVRSVDLSLEAVEEIISALLDISRIDAGAMKPERSVFPVNELLQNLNLEFGPVARDKGLKFHTVASSAIVETDRKLLRRILQNLVSNAVKYTPSGEVLMGCRRIGNMLRIEVHDTGHGIAEDKRDVVFREFERINQGHGESGLGLGLSIVERIAKMLGHSITLRSTLGRGTMFAISIPLAKDQAVSVPQARTSTVRRGLGAVLNVMVIDNEPSIIAGMTALLEGWGCNVVSASSVAEALTAFEAVDGRIDIILADYHLHRDDGIALVDRLRSRARKPIPAVLITAERSKHVQDLALAHDIQYIRKPVKPAALRAAINHASMRAEAAE
jgi:Na+/proline symporter/CheY-like chemotaxis protein